MRIQILSDIHLEFGLRKYDFSDADLIVLAGDIHIGINGIDWIKNEIKDKPVIYVLGNHEYYKHSYPKLINKIKTQAIDSNVHVLENEKVQIDDVIFHGSTLWTDFKIFGDPRHSGMECQLRMNDYNLIRKDPSYSKLRSIDTHMIHNESVNWLRQSLSDSDSKQNVVVTHHAPSIESVALRYRDDLLSAGFASNLESLIRDTNPDLWIHGHMHESFDYKIGQTRVLCNPFGYPDEKNENFKDNLIVTIGV